MRSSARVGHVLAVALALAAPRRRRTSRRSARWRRARTTARAASTARCSARPTASCGRRRSRSRCSTSPGRRAGSSLVRRVGGQQTLGLALAGQDGRSYTFRGLDKDPSNILPDELQDTFVEELVQDQMSAQHPAGALVADELARAAGVPTVPIRLVVLPDDPALGEERKAFASLLGTFSEYPTAADARHPGFEDAVEIVDHMTLYAKLAQEPRRAGGGARVPAGAPLRRLRLRLRPAPQAVALGEEERGRPAGTRSRRTATRPSRATRASWCARPRGTCRSCGPSGRSTTASSASPSTAGSRTAGCCRSCRARRGTRWRRT